MIKITIENEGMEPIVLENVTEYVLFSEDEKGYECNVDADVKFKGFVEAQARLLFEDSFRENTDFDEVVNPQ